MDRTDMPKKIRNKIILSFTLMIVLMTLFLLIFFNDLIRETHLTIIKREMREKTLFIEHDLIKSHKLTADRKRIASTVSELANIIGLRITLVEPDGTVIADSEVKDVASMDNHRYRTEISNALERGFGEIIRYSNTLRIDMLYFAKRMDRMIIRLAKPLYEIEESLNKIRDLLITLGTLLIIASMVIVTIISRRITRPVKETLEFAKQFSEGDYSRRILNYSDDEIGSLQRALNELADTIVDKIATLLLEQRKLQITIESIEDGIAVIDSQKKILIANRSFSSILNIRYPVIDRMYFEIIRGSSFNAKIEYSLLRGVSIKFDEEFLNGRICEVLINPITEEKTIQGILIVLHDITEKKKIDQMKTDLVGNLSHELKTPITILKGYLETIYDNIENDETNKDYIKKALASIDRQNSIINDMLKLNMLETSINIPMEEISLKTVINNCIELLSPKAVNRNIEIKKLIDAIDDSIKCNRFLSEEVFFNLIDNAINYNRENGSVTIQANGESNNLIISISDTGIGIPNESLDRIFERFYRVDKSRSRSTGGTGLGLSIVKHAIELLNWSIGVSSSNEGTTFTVEIHSQDINI
jgi:two-component system phosphate regulon sensor histidine kinase PhoR